MDFLRSQTFGTNTGKILTKKGTKQFRADNKVKRAKLATEVEELVKAATPKRKTQSKGQRFRILARDKYACVYCGAPGGSIRPDGSTVVLEIDHRVSVADSVGEVDESDENKCACCSVCNAGKKARSVLRPVTVDNSRIVEQLAELVGKKKPIQKGGQ